MLNDEKYCEVLYANDRKSKSRAIATTGNEFSALIKTEFGS